MSCQWQSNILAWHYIYLLCSHCQICQNCSHCKNEDQWCQHLYYCLQHSRLQSHFCHWYLSHFLFQNCSLDQMDLHHWFLLSNLQYVYFLIFRAVNSHRNPTLFEIPNYHFFVSTYFLPSLSNSFHKKYSTVFSRIILMNIIIEVLLYVAGC